MAPPQKTVLITGCTPGGIGHSLALTLSQAPYNYKVFATARTPSSLQSLKGKTNITPIEADVTDSASIKKLKETVSAATGGKLDYLVNNAGRNYTVPGLEVDMSEVRLTFETNVFGVIELCNAFAPLLIATARENPNSSSIGSSFLAALNSLTLGVLGIAPLNNRPAIVQIGSLAGVMPYVFGSVYNASKAALHSYTDTIRLELEPFGVDVVTIVTGGVKSNIARTKQQLRPDSLYKACETEYIRRQTHSQQVGLANEVYAKRVATDFTAWYRKARYWEGGLVLGAWFATNYLPRGVIETFMRTSFGLAKLAKVESRKRK